MTSILPFDELNAFEFQIKERFGRDPLKEDAYEDTIDELLDLFLLSYAQATAITNDRLSYNWQPTLDDVAKTLDEKVAGKNWKERVEEYFASGGNADDIVRIAETESHRIANTAALDTARKAGAKTKTWVTMLDDKVRDTHSPLEGVSAPIDGEFVTWDGDRAQAPGLFSLPQNNVNCRCELLFE